MAHKRKKGHHRRRRRIGAMSMNVNSPIVKYAPIVLGYLVAAAPIKTAVDKALVNVTDPTKKLNDQKMIYGGMTLGGAYMMFMDKGKKSVMKSVISGVLIGAGLKNAMTSFGIAGIGGYGQVKVLSGYGQVPAIGDRMRGYVPQGTLNGYAPQGTLNGANVMGAVGSGSANGSGLSNGGSSLMG
jgi:hypothetical protein